MGRWGDRAKLGQQDEWTEREGEKEKRLVT
jgi:hypothetical protein